MKIILILILSFVCSISHGQHIKAAQFSQKIGPQYIKDSILVGMQKGSGQAYFNLNIKPGKYRISLVAATTYNLSIFNVGGAKINVSNTGRWDVYKTFSTTKVITDKITTLVVELETIMTANIKEIIFTKVK